jgi:hypothetical protein
VESRVQALVEAVDNKTPERIRPGDLHKLIISWKLRKACGLDGTQNECLRHLRRRSLVHLHIYLNSTSGSLFPKSWKEAKVITLLKGLKIPSKFTSD